VCMCVCVCARARVHTHTHTPTRNIIKTNNFQISTFVTLVLYGGDVLEASALLSKGIALDDNK
jgi:hypothetical protein